MDPTNWRAKLESLYWQRVYSSEDLLYQALFDKAHRPEVFTQRSAGNRVEWQEPQQVSPVEFIEMRYLEQVNSQRVALLMKLPALCSLALCVVLARSMVRSHGRMLTHEQYLHVGSGRKTVHNSLLLMLLVIRMMTLATAGGSVLLCGYQYGTAARQRYFSGVEFEQELMVRHAGAVKGYWASR